MHIPFFKRFGERLSSTFSFPALCFFRFMTEFSWLKYQKIHERDDIDARILVFDSVTIVGTFNILKLKNYFQSSVVYKCIVLITLNICIV